MVFIFGLVCSLLGNFRVEGMESRTVTYNVYKFVDRTILIGTFKGDSLDKATSDENVGLEPFLSSNNFVIVHTINEGDVCSLYVVTTDQMRKITDFNEYNKVLALLDGACLKFCDPGHIDAFKGDENNDVYEYNESIFVLDKSGHRIKNGCFLDASFNPKKPYKYFLPGYSEYDYLDRIPIRGNEKVYFEAQYKSVYSSPVQGGGSKSGPSSSNSSKSDSSSSNNSNSCCCR